MKYENEEEFMADLVNRLKDARIKKGISLLQLATRCGTERARLSEIENNRAGLTLKRLYNICEALGIDLEIKFN